MKVDLSIIIPTYKRGNLVVDAIQSALKVEDVMIEILVMDDCPEGSAESFVRTIQDKRVVYRKRNQPSGGFPALLRNECASLAKGRYLYFLDDDDTVEAKTLAKMVHQLNRCRAGVAIAAVAPHGPDGNRVVSAEKRQFSWVRDAFNRYKNNRFLLLSQLLFGTPMIVCSACMIRKSCFERIGGFDHRLPLYEDVEMYIRSIRAFGFVFINDVLLNRRTGEPSLINNEQDEIKTLQSYKMMYSNYRQANSWLELKALRLLRLFLPRPATS